MVSTELDLEISEFNKSYWKKKNPQTSFLEHFNVTQHSPNNCMLDKLILLQMNDFSIYWVVIVFIFFTHSSSSLYFASYNFFFSKNKLRISALSLFNSPPHSSHDLSFQIDGNIIPWLILAIFAVYMSASCQVLRPSGNENLYIFSIHKLWLSEWVRASESECEWVCALGRT